MTALWHARSLFRHAFPGNMALFQARSLTLPPGIIPTRFPMLMSRHNVSSWTSRRKPLKVLHASSRPSPGYFSPSSFSTQSGLPVLSQPSVGYWLICSSALVFGIVVVGGVTRLTESGLSITEWRPVSGVLPPLTPSDWDAEFDKYKTTPEFKLYVHCMWLGYTAVLRLSGG